MMARERGNLEAEMKEVSKELLNHEMIAVPDQQQERGESSAASAAPAVSDYVGASLEETKREVSVVDDRHHGSPISVEDSVVVHHAVEPRNAGESSIGHISIGDAPALTAKKSKKGRTSKKNRGKQKANQEVNEPEVELLSIRIEDPPPAPPKTTITTSTPAGPAESHKKPENKDDHVSGNGLEVQADSTAESTQVNDQPGSQATVDNDMKDNLDFEDEQKYEIEIEAGLAAASSRPFLEWGLCGEDDRGPPVRTPPRTPPLREPRVRHKVQGQGQGRQQEQPPSPGVTHLSQSPREPWKRKSSEARLRHESVRSSSVAQPQSPAVTTIEAHELEGLSEWNRIKAMHHSAAAEVASHKNWVPRKGIQRGGEGGDHNKGRGKAKQGRGEQNSQHNHNHHTKELVRQKFEADLRIKQQELLQRSKQTLKAEFQKAKRIEASRKGRDELELELERNLFYRDGDLIYLNQ